MNRPIFLLLLASAALTLAFQDVDHDASKHPTRYLNPKDRADDRPFSHAVLAGDTLYVAGTLGIDPATGEVPDDVGREVHLVLDGIRAKLALAGMQMDDLVSVQVFCPDLSLYEPFNAIYATYFEAHYPARAFIGSGPLLRGARFEVSAVAVAPR